MYVESVSIGQVVHTQKMELALICRRMEELLLKDFAIGQRSERGTKYGFI